MPSRSAARDEPLRMTINRFQLHYIGKHKTIIIIGKRGSGKSLLVIDFLHSQRAIPFGMVISPTEIFNNTYTPHVPAKLIFPEYTPELIEIFINRQKAIVDRVKHDPAYAREDPSAFLILDDCLADAPNWRNDINLRVIMMNGRHIKITFILTMQEPMGIPPSLRGQMQWCFICKNNARNEREKIWRNYATIFPTLPVFEKVLMKCTENYRCLVIDTSSLSYNISDAVFWYKASIHGPFRTCFSELWKHKDQIIEKRRRSLFKHSSHTKVADSDPDAEYKRLIRKRNDVPFDVDLRGSRALTVKPGRF
jgi:hypothetical protein